MVQLDDEGAAFDFETLSSREALAEDLMLGARMSRGISYDLLRRAAAVIPPSRLLETLKEAVDLGLLGLSDSWDSLEAAMSRGRGHALCQPGRVGLWATSCTACCGTCTRTLAPVDGASYSPLMGLRCIK